MEIINCSARDIPRLAAMNKRLIEDEGSPNPMGPAELERRMGEFLRRDYEAFFFTEGGTVIGYALVRHTSVPPYLRQFYIDREYRRRHCGRKAFEMLMDVLGTDEIDIDVLPWNEAGRLFWKSLGFRETCVSMKYRMKKPEEGETEA